MAVDYFHRLVVEGPDGAVRDFRNRIYREYPRTVARRTWTEIVPFSFSGLYDLAPGARRISREIPFDPYDLRAWPIRRLTKRKSEVRYQFHTRNLEMAGFIRVLSRAVPALTFTLLTLCLDDSEIATCWFSSGLRRRWVLTNARGDFHWQRASRKFRLVGDDLYESDEADRWAEEQMMGEALTHWDQSARTRRARYQWWNRFPLRDLETERAIFCAEMKDDPVLAATGTRSSAAKRAT